MAQNTIPEWLRLCGENTAATLNQVRRGEIDDSFGWGAVLEAMWKRPDHPSGLLLTGQEGCGKHTAQAHMLRLLLNDGYEVLIISDDVFPENPSGTAEILEQYLSKKQKICVVLDQLTQTRRNFVSCCGRMMERVKDMFLILLEQEPDWMPSTLRSRLLRCHMNLPAAENRWEFMKGYLEQCFGLQLRYYVKEEQLNPKTAGFTYAQLKDLTYNMGLMIEMDDSDGIGEYLVQFAEEQAALPQRGEGNDLLHDQLCDLVEQLPNLLKTMQEEASARSQRFAETLAEAISQGGGIVMQSVSAGQSGAKAQSNTVDEAQFTESESERIRNMAPAALFEDLIAPLPELE